MLVPVVSRQVEVLNSNKNCAECIHRAAMVASCSSAAPRPKEAHQPVEPVCKEGEVVFGCVDVSDDGVHAVDLQCRHTQTHIKIDKTQRQLCEAWK